MKVYVTVADTTPPAKPMQGMELVQKVIDPEITKFEEWFRQPERGNGPLLPLERDLLRSYLYQKLVGTL